MSTLPPSLYKQAQQIKGTNSLPVTEKGLTYHVGTKKGQVANRVILVGDLNRANTLGHFLDNKPSFAVMSSRGFYTITGTYKGVPVSIIGTGMGYPMIDFSIRECRCIVDGPMAIIRLGTCGSPSSEPGKMVIANEACMVQRNPNAFRKQNEGKNLPHYLISDPVASSPALTNLLVQNLEKIIGAENVVIGLNATGDSFYSSQGRSLAQFNDNNGDVIDSVIKKYPQTQAIEMETFHLFDMAECSNEAIHAAAAMIVLAQRSTGTFLALEKKEKLEKIYGEAALNTLIELPLEGTMNNEECIWNQEIPSELQFVRTK